MGGDGGLMMALQAIQQVVDLQKLVFVSLPFGSGNDMAQA
jgi:diacylglycerol kinase family enzyme